MKVRCVLPALAGVVLTLSGCVTTGPAYVAGPVATTDFILTYGYGYAGTGYYYGPRNLTYYHRGPGVYYYRSRAHVPQHYWRHYHAPRAHGVPPRYDYRGPSRYYRKRY